MLKIFLPMALIIIFPSNLFPLTMLFMVMILIKMLSFLFNIKYVINSIMFIDMMNIPLLILTIWISSLMIYASIMSVNKKSVFLLNYMIFFLMFILSLSFMINNMMLYYILFEASLIPTMIIIMGWGYQPERLQASMYMMMYTITASLPFLVMIIYHLLTTKSLNFFFMFNMLKYDFLTSMFFAMAFMVKMPMYISHLWLPKAHVEAPVAGSMILAGILLKLGGYGIIRMMNMIKPIFLMTQSLFISISMWGALITSFICIRQQDMKSLIAYSSVGHMALIITSLMSSTKWALEGSISMMIAHGLSSPALFSLANMSYEMNKTRSLMLAKGMLFLLPTMSVWWFFMTIANMAAPPTLNLMAEIMLMTSIISNNLNSMVFIGVVSFLAAVYSLILYTSSNHGKPMLSTNPPMNNMTRNSMLIIFHMTPLYLMILSPSIFMMFS